LWSTLACTLTKQHIVLSQSQWVQEEKQTLKINQSLSDNFETFLKKILIQFNHILC
jgi:hypothetical protein